MNTLTLIRQESAGFAYSAYEKIIKIEMRHLQDGWHISERAGTRGGTLVDTVCQSGLTFDEANLLFGDRIYNAKRAGFVIHVHGRD